MKKFDIKSFVVGFIIGTLGITTAFAASGIKSAVLSNAKVTLDGVVISLNKPLVSVTKEDEKNASLYMPGRELLEYLGYAVNWDGAKNSVNLVSNKSISNVDVFETLTNDGNVVINLKNNINQFNISESGEFQAENNQILTLKITSTIKGGTVDLFLTDPNGKEQQYTIGSEITIKEINLIKGVWKYTCSGIFRDGGDIQIVGTTSDS